MVMVIDDRATRNESLGAVVLALRKRAQLSQEELAEQADLTLAELDEIEAGSREALWGDLRRLASALGISLPALLLEVEARKP
jgi:transcriptional regulator with XRE-family HTH domain